MLTLVSSNARPVYAPDTPGDELVGGAPMRHRRGVTELCRDRLVVVRMSATRSLDLHEEGRVHSTHVCTQASYSTSGFESARLASSLKCRQKQSFSGRVID